MQPFNIHNNTGEDTRAVPEKTLPSIISAQHFARNVVAPDVLFFLFECLGLLPVSAVVTWAGYCPYAGDRFFNVILEWLGLLPRHS